jgi:putative ABC transport system ATP-binding protein
MSPDPAPASSTNGGAEAIARLCDVSKSYFKTDGTVMVEALQHVDLDIPKGQFVAIMGASGSGKSTLMNILGCLDQPTRGSYLLDGDDISQLEDDQISEIRGRKIGFVFQAFNLISELTIVENVEVPLFYQGVEPVERRARAIETLDMVGLADRVTHRPRELSGGQQQRAAIARALVTTPTITMADEPTGNLDSKTGESILNLVTQLHERGLTIIMVTHDERIAERCQRIVHLRDGRIDRDELH